MKQILIETDRSCEMARVSLGGELIMEGNYWDFHPGCHGIDKYGDFNSYQGLANQLASYCFNETGERPEFISKSYSYN